MYVLKLVVPYEMSLVSISEKISEKLRIDMPFILYWSLLAPCSVFMKTGLNIFEYTHLSEKLSMYSPDIYLYMYL